MTTIDIDTIPAGRELDELIDERLFGFLSYEFIQNREVEFVDGVWRDKQTGKQYRGNAAESYSTDIAAAWLVVGAMNKKFIFVVSLDCAPDSWLASFIHGMRGMDEYIEAENNAPTAPLAICRAALKASEA